MSGFLYLDYNATTPIDPRVAEEMMPFLSGGFGNPSSSHKAGRQASAAVARARERVADALAAKPGEIVFTSGGTEANNMAIRGVVHGIEDAHIVTSAIEHPAVLEVVRALEREGAVQVSMVGVDSVGRVEPAAVQAALRPTTRLVSVMLANNEVGTIQPVREIAAICRPRGVLMHTDAAQAVGKIPVDVGELGVDLLSVAGHKLYAPKGVGALFVRDGVRMEPLLRGAGHERGLRAGTENVLEIVGLGMACALLREGLAKEMQRLSSLRDRLSARLHEALGPLQVHARRAPRLPNTLSVALPGVEASRLLDALSDEVAASAGAACHSEAVHVSHVLAAIGVDAETARRTVRLSLGRFTEPSEVDEAVVRIERAVEGIRGAAR